MCVCSRRLRRRWGRALVIAFLVRARDHRTGLQILFHQVLTPAARAFFRNWLVRGSVLALRIIAASIEGVAFTRPLFDQLSVFALGTLHADEVLLHVLAVRISAAGRELAVAPVADHHIASALGAKFVQRNVRNLLALIQAASGLAVGIPGTRHELAEAPTLKHHHSSAVFAVFLLRGTLHICRIQIGQVDRIFLGERAGVGIFLIVGAAGVKRAVLAPLDHQRRATFLALLISGLLHPLDVFHVLFGILQVLLEFLPEIRHGVLPLLFAFFDFI